MAKSGPVILGANGEPLRRSYEAAERNRIYPNLVRTLGANTELSDAARVMFSDARWLEQNHDVAVAMIDEWTNAVVGGSLELIPLPHDRNGVLLESFAQEIADIFEAWGEQPEVTRSFNWQALVRIAAASSARDGEIFGRHIVGDRDGAPWDSGALPYMVQVLEADFCDHDTNRSRAPEIINGVEINRWGRALAYHMFQRHPHETRWGMGESQRRRVRRPSDSIVHYKHVRRVGQVRGASLFASITNRLRDIKDIEESERLATRLGSKLAVAITRHPELWEQYEERDDPRSVDAERTLEFESGSIWDSLLPGEDVRTIKTERPNIDQVPYNREQLRRACAGFGVKYSNVARDWSGTYSSQRQELVEMRFQARPKRDHCVDRWIKPIYSMVLTVARLSGRLRLPRALDPRTLGWFEISENPIPWIQPDQEITAAIKERDAGLVSDETLMRERNRDPRKEQQRMEQANDERAAETRPDEPNAPAQLNLVETGRG